MISSPLVFLFTSDKGDYMPDRDISCNKTKRWDKYKSTSKGIRDGSLNICR
jgi:hypothetical protein